MKRTILYWLCVAAVCCCLLQPLTIYAVTPLDPAHRCSLTLHYTQEGVGFAGLEVRLYRVAEAFTDGTFALIEPFSGYPVNIHGITSQLEWRDVANTLTAYIAADQVQPDREDKTGEEGTVVFSDLETGLYLVSGAVAGNDRGVWRFDAFVVYLPAAGEEDFNYDVEAIPKCGSFTPGTEYSVIKLWKDGGRAGERPVSVTVDLLKDGTLQETVVLSAENDWSYSWRTADAQGLWTVVERDVPEDYQVVITNQETTFIITNTSPDTSEVPDTGDTSPLWFYVVTLCISGLGLLLVGAWGMRGKKYENGK